MGKVFLLLSCTTCSTLSLVVNLESTCSRFREFVLLIGHIFIFYPLPLSALPCQCSFFLFFFSVLTGTATLVKRKSVKAHSASNKDPTRDFLHYPASVYVKTNPSLSAIDTCLNFLVEIIINKVGQPGSVRSSSIVCCFFFSFLLFFCLDKHEAWSIPCLDKLH